MIELDDIHKAFNQGQPNEYWALNGIHLKVAAHQVTALSGPSGSGKTTLLTLLGCLARPTRAACACAARTFPACRNAFSPKSAAAPSVSSSSSSTWCAACRRSTT